MEYSVIVPVHNEKESLAALFQGIRRNLDSLGREYEILFVDDASTDGSADILKQIPGENLKLRLLRLEERRGMATALQAGFDRAQGRVFITLDADLQNDPSDIPALLEKLDEGYDLVCGWRKNRQDPLSKKIASTAANGLRKILTGEKVHDVGCTLRVFKREVVRDMRLFGGMHRYFTAMAARGGFRIAEIEVRHHPRRHGRSKFGVWDRFVQGAGDLSRFYFSGKNRGENPGYAVLETVTR